MSISSVVLAMEDIGWSFSVDVFKVLSIYMCLYKWQVYLQFRVCGALCSACYNALSLRIVEFG
jgi:hypothetical protein